MAVTVNYNPNPMLVGRAAFEAGLGQYLQKQQAFEEEQRQFNIAHGLDESGQPMQQPQQPQQLPELPRGRQVGGGGGYGGGRGRNDLLQFYGDALQQQNARVIARERNWAMSRDEMIRGQYDLQDRYMQEQAANFRAEENNRAQLDRQRWEAEQKAYDADRANVDRYLQQINASDAEREEAYGKLAQKHPQAASGMPAPQLPEAYDPIKKLENARTSAPGMPWYLDDTGNPALPDGFKPEMNDEWAAKEQQRKIDLEKEKNAIADEDARVKRAQEVADKEQERIQKAKDAELDMKIKMYNHKFDAGLATIDAGKPDQKDFMVPSSDPKTGKIVQQLDKQKYAMAFEAWAKKKEEYIAGYDAKYENIPDPYGTFAQPTATPGQGSTPAAPAQNGSPYIPAPKFVGGVAYLDKDPAVAQRQARSLPPGTVFIAPNGKLKVAMGNG